MSYRATPEVSVVRTDDGWKIANALWHFTNSA
jgi:hypothetical protein